jgi:hypothetical protein
MTLNRLFLAFALAAGLAVGAALVSFPALRATGLPPVFMVLIVLAIFDGICFYRNGATPGGMITMPVRFAGFLLAIGGIAVIASWTGTEMRYF